MGKKAALYCRVSTEEQAKEGFSIAAQKKTLVLYCEAHGFEVYDIYTDEGISGKSTDRPAFQQILRDAKNRLFDMVVVWKINRFSRKTSDLLNTVEYLNKLNVSLVSFSEQFDTSTPSGRLMLSMLGSIGEFERDTIVENIKSGMNERAYEGLFNGGRILGYDSFKGKLFINAEESRIVTRIFRLYIEGLSFSSIKNILDSENVATKNKLPFSLNSIKRILSNPIYAGYIKYNSRSLSPILVKGVHENIISEEDFNTASRIMASRKQSHKIESSYLLTGSLKCPYCGGKMIGHTGKCRTGSSCYRYYVCLKYKNMGKSCCRGIYVEAGCLEKAALDYLSSLISIPSVKQDILRKINEKYINSKSLNGKSIEDTLKEIRHMKSSRDKYFHLYEEGFIKSEDFYPGIDKINSKIEIIEQKMEHTDKPGMDFPDAMASYIVENFKSYFYSLGNTAKRKVINSLITEIELSEDRQIKNIIPRFKLPQCDTRYTDHNV